jgi:hypothetical protein
VLDARKTIDNSELCVARRIYRRPRRRQFYWNANKIQASTFGIAPTAAAIGRGKRPGGEALDPGKPADVKKAFNIGLELAPDDPEPRARAPFRGANVWPEMPGFRDTMLDYFNLVWRRGCDLHPGFAFDLDSDFFEPRLDKPIATLIATLKSQIAILEERLRECAQPRPQHGLLKSVPGIGQTLATVIFLETGPVERFAEVGDFASYTRCVDNVLTSNRKKKGDAIVARLGPRRVLIVGGLLAVAGFVVLLAVPLRPIAMAGFC